MGIARRVNAPPAQWDKAKAYKAGGIVLWEFMLIEAVKDIPADTTFAWQTTADIGVNATATWRPVLWSDRVWKGYYSDTTDYAVGDVVAGGAANRLFTCTTAMTASTNNNPYSGTNRGAWTHVQNSIGYAMLGSGVDSGTPYQGVQGLVPGPPANTHYAPLMGNGWWGINLTTPANNAKGRRGSIAVDSSYLYVWTADDTVKRIALSSF